MMRWLRVSVTDSRPWPRRRLDKYPFRCFIYILARYKCCLLTYLLTYLHRSRHQPVKIWSPMIRLPNVPSKSVIIRQLSAFQTSTTAKSFSVITKLKRMRAFYSSLYRAELQDLCNTSINDICVVAERSETCLEPSSGYTHHSVSSQVWYLACLRWIVLA